MTCQTVQCANPDIWQKTGVMHMAGQMYRLWKMAMTYTAG